MDRRATPHLPGRAPAGGLRLPSQNFLALCFVCASTGYALFSGLALGMPVGLAFIVSGWLVALCLHEWGHAYAAHKGGDHEIADTGYLSLDPLKYTDPTTSIVLPAIFLLMGGFALPGGAVLVNRSNLRGVHWESFVSAAGPLATLACLLAVALPFNLGLPDEVGTEEFWGALATLGYVLCGALVLNLLPLPGLDGMGIIRPYLPWSWQLRVNAMSFQLSLFLLAAILFVPAFSRLVMTAAVRVALWAGLDMAYVIDGLRTFLAWV